jgi:putative ABC transport system permease protein
MSLGATSTTILSQFISRGLVAAASGVALGLAGALAIARILSSMLYQISIVDPVTYLTAVVILLAVVLLASYIPARRATKVEPVIALKYE